VRTIGKKGDGTRFISFERTALIAKRGHGIKIQTRTRRTGSPKGGPQRRAPVGVKSDEPLYLQVVRALKDEIGTGVHPVGTQLPTEEELCERFSVSRHTVREALRRLREDNLVSSRQGAGTIVIPPRPAESFVHEVLSINDLVAFATGVRFAIDTIEIDDKLASRTGIASGEKWQSGALRQLHQR
jgi:DNA-binding transcriptional regulator YhcF (GntR family)